MSHADRSQLQKELARQLHEQYQQTNQGVLDNQTEYLSLRRNNTLVVATPKLEGEPWEAPPLSRLFPRGQYISLQEVLDTINQQSKFLDEFEH
jgi:hypothetical protein